MRNYRLIEVLMPTYGDNVKNVGFLINDMVDKLRLHNFDDLNKDGETMVLFNYDEVMQLADIWETTEVASHCKHKLVVQRHESNAWVDIKLIDGVGELSAL